MPAASTDPLPRLEGQGVEAVVHLGNREHWVIRNVEITNITRDASDYNEVCPGVVITLADYGQAHGYEVSDRHPGPVSQGPRWRRHPARGLGRGSAAPTSFRDVKVHHNRIDHVFATKTPRAPGTATSLIFWLFAGPRWR